MMPDSSALDPFDKAILATLDRDARASHIEIADRVNLSSSAIARRIRRLEAEGWIAGYRAEMSLGSFGFHLTAFVQLTLEGQSARALDAAEEAMRRCPSVIACHLMSGGSDYLLVLAARDMADYERVHREELATIPGVMRIQSNFSLREVMGWATPKVVLGN